MSRPCIWLFALCLTAWHAPSAEGRFFQTQTQLEAVAVPKMHVVIAMHREDPAAVQAYVDQLVSVPSVAQTKPRIYVYVKGGADVAAQVSLRRIAHEVIELPNIGREQETYLQHIIAHYDNLPQHILFSQVCPYFHAALGDKRLVCQMGS